LKVEIDSQFNAAGGSEFQVRGAAVLNYRLANDVRQNGTHSSGTDDDRVLRAPVRNEMCWFVYCGYDGNTYRLLIKLFFFYNSYLMITEFDDVGLSSDFYMKMQ